MWGRITRSARTKWHWRPAAVRGGGSLAESSNHGREVRRVHQAGAIAGRTRVRPPGSPALRVRAAAGVPRLTSPLSTSRLPTPASRDPARCRRGSPPAMLPDRLDVIACTRLTGMQALVEIASVPGNWPRRSTGEPAGRMIGARGRTIACVPPFETAMNSSRPALPVNAPAWCVATALEITTFDPADLGEIRRPLRVSVTSRCRPRSGRPRTGSSVASRRRLPLTRAGFRPVSSTGRPRSTWRPVPESAYPCPLIGSGDHNDALSCHVSSR